MAKQASFLPAPYPCRSLSKYKMVSKKPSLSEKAPVFIRIHHLIHKIPLIFQIIKEVQSPFLKLRLLCCLRGSETLTTTPNAGAKNGDCLLPRGTMPEHGLRA